MTPPTRDQIAAHFQVSLEKADAIRITLQMAITDLRENPDDRQVANVVAFTRIHARRMAVLIEHEMAQIP